jgi:opacity protein-like surface antigen
MKVSGSSFMHGAAMGLAVLGAAQAAAQTASDRSSDWSFEISPYLWAAALDGTIRPRPTGPAFESSLSFGDILDNLDAGIFVSGSARRDRFVMAGDFYYISLSDTVRAPSPFTFANLRGKAEVMQGTLVAGWRAVDRPAHSLDLMAGLRAGENDIEVQGRINDRTVLRVTEDISYAAPLLAVRGRVALGDRVSLTGYGDLGGGTSSVDSTWQLSATLDYHLSDSVSVSAGYRHEELDINNSSGARSSTATSGFLLGTRLRF